MPAIQIENVVDLVDETGNLISPIQLNYLITKKNDVSNLNPKSDKNWSEYTESKIIQQVDQSICEIETKMGRFAEMVGGGAGEMVFKVRLGKRILNFNIGRTIRNSVVRNEILSKLGFWTPKYCLTKNVKLQFEDEKSKVVFYKGLRENISKYKELISEVGIAQDEVIIKDVYVTEISDQLDTTYDFRGLMHNENKRSQNSLIIPWAVTALPESVDATTWTVGYREGANYFIPHRAAESFSLGYFDAKWIAKKMAKLTRNDYEDAVKKARYIDPIGKLIVEQLISRHNSLIKPWLSEYTELPVNYELDVPPIIEKGKINCANLSKSVESNLERFCSKELPELFTLENVLPVLKSILYSNISNSILDAFNTKFLVGPTVNKKMQEVVEDRVNRQLEKMLETGDFHEIKIGTVSVPFITGGLAYSRDILLGNVLGLKNKFQRVDTLGYQVSAGGAGRYFGKNQSQLPVYNISGSKQYFLTRITPISNLKSALEPNSEIDTSIVTLWKDQLVNLEDKSEINVKEKLSKFKQYFRVGESIILTESLAANEVLGIGFPFGPNVSLFGKVFSSQRLLKRIHIHRPNSDLLQIYESDASDFTSPLNNYGFNLNSFISIFSWQKTEINPSISTNLFLIDLRETSKAGELVLALAELFSKNNLTGVKNLSRIVTISHAATQEIVEKSFLSQSKIKYNTKDAFTITAPNGAQKKLYYHSYLSKYGSNNLALGVDVANSIISEVLKIPNFKLNLVLASEPGSTPGGESESIEYRYEHDYNPNGSILESSFVINETEKKWSILFADYVVKMQSLNEKYGADYFDFNKYRNFDRINFFNLTTQLVVKSNGIQNLLAVPITKIEELLKTGNRLSEPWCLNEKSKAECDQQKILKIKFAVDKINRLQEKAVSNSNFELNSHSLLDYVSVLDQLFERGKFLEIIEPENYTVRSYVEGHRHGDASYIEKKYLSSNVVGTGGRYPGGPVNYFSQVLNLVTEQINLISSEILAEWIIKK